MEGFRCYFLDSNDHIQAREEIDAESLPEAIKQAQMMCRSRPQHYSFEIWQGKLRIYGPELTS